MHALLAAFLALPSGSPLLTVDDTPGSGAQYATIQAAVDAAPAGATIRIADGTYAGFVVDGKDLALTADNAASVLVTSTVTVRNVAAGQQVLVRRLLATAASTHALVVETSPGTVWLEECSFQSAVPAGASQHGATAMRVTSAADVRAVRTLVAGAHGTSEGAWGSGVAKSGGIGLDAQLSTVRLYDCEVRGGSGGGAIPYGFLHAGHGAHAIKLDGSRLHAWGTTLRGGYGGYSDYCYCPGQLYCGNPGVGGDCVRASAPPPGISLEFLGVTLLPGGGGPNGNEPICAGGPDGVWVSGLTPAQAQVTPGPHRAFYSKSPVDDGDSALLFLEGVSGDLAVVTLGIPLPPLALPGTIGELFLTPVGALVFAGPWSAAALQPLSVGVPTQPAGFESLRVHLQGAVVTPSGEIRLLAPASLVVIDDAL